MARCVAFWETVVISSCTLSISCSVLGSHFLSLLGSKRIGEMSDRVTLTQDLEAVLRAHGVDIRDLPNVVRATHPPYRQFPLQLDGSMLDGYLTLFKKVAYSAILSHAPQVAPRVTSKYDAWEWVKHHARMYMAAPSGASLDRRIVIGGMAGAFDGALIAMGRVKYALHWPLFFRSEFISLRQELSACRMAVFG